MSESAVAAAAAEAAFLDELRRRVAWPSEAAARIRQGLPLEPEVAEPVAEEPHAAEAPGPAPLAVEPAPRPPAPCAAAPAPRAIGQSSLWSLERIAREAAAVDPARAEELSFTLLYLRHYADPSGLLPPGFSELVERVFCVGESSAFANGLGNGGVRR